MKIAISIPDPVFQAAEQLAKRMKKPRSRLYAEAIEQYVDSHDTKTITERLNCVYGSEPSTVDEGLARAQIKTVENEAW